MNKSKIEWCDMTWNPVTECLHNCEYCYAEKIAKRFGDGWGLERNTRFLEMPAKPINPYPDKFNPSFHKYRLNEPTKIKKPQNVFVCSMADLFGEWIPDQCQQVKHLNNLIYGYDEILHCVEMGF